MNRLKIVLIGLTLITFLSCSQENDNCNCSETVTIMESNDGIDSVYDVIYIDDSEYDCYYPSRDFTRNTNYNYITGVLTYERVQLECN